MRSEQRLGVRWGLAAALLLGAVVALTNEATAADYVRIQKKPALSYAHFSQAETTTLESLGVTVLDDYGPFAMGIATGTADLVKAGASVGVTIGPEPDAYRVDGGSIPIDIREPDNATKNVPADLLLDDYPGALGLYLVKFRGPVVPSWLDSLAAADARIIQYVHKDAYIVAAPGGIGRMKALVKGPLTYVGVFHPYFKLATGLTTGPALGGIAAVRVRVTLDPEQDLQAITAQLKAVDSRADIHSDRNTAGGVLSAPAAAWRRFARDPAVLAIEPWNDDGGASDERINQVIAVRRDGNGIPTQPTTYKSWLGTLCNGLCGDLSSHIVDIMDSGIASNDDGVGAYHPDLPATRIVNPRLYFGMPTVDDRYFHGTLVAGLIGGDPSLVGGAGRTDTQGFYYDMGVAPTVRLHPSRVINGAGQLGGVITAAVIDQVVGNAYTDGARFQNSSWYEGNTSYGYTSVAREYDRVIRNARLNNNPDEQLMVVFAAGNNFNGDTTKSVLAPATAKNAIAVGATALQRGPNYGGTLGGNCDTTHRIWDIAEFSRQGVYGNPNRFKPDIYSPGQNISAARSAAMSTSLYSFCAGVIGLHLPSPDGPNYPANGTSFSAPVVTGAAVLAKQKIRADTGNTNASPALIKAALLSTTETDSLNGGYNYYQSANNVWEPTSWEGFGRVALTSLLEDPVAKAYIEEDHGATPTNRFVQAGIYKNYTFTVADPTKAISAVLVYSDAPAAVGATTVKVNEIDMYVLQGGYIYCDGQYGQQYATRSTGCWLPDMDNNVKRARIAPNSFSGQFTIQLVSANIAANAVPGRDNGQPNQDWALYVYNAVRN